MRNPNVRAPLAVGWAARRMRELVDHVASGRSVTIPRGDRLAVPPRRLRARTGAPGVREFVEGGRQAATELSAVLGAAGHPLQQMGSVLDFGCGSGRVLPQVASLAPQARCTGADVDPLAIRWAGSHRPEHQWARSDFNPPLPFAAESFDLVYSISVFSHLDQRLQDDWLAELRRALRPGGLALLSVHGPHAFEQFRTGSVRTAWCGADAFARGPLGPEEFVFAPYSRSIWNQAELPGVGSGYGLAFHSQGYIRRHWASIFEIEHVEERALTAWQDLVLCRRS